MDKLKKWKIERILELIKYGIYTVVGVAMIFIMLIFIVVLIRLLYSLCCWII